MSDKTMPVLNEKEAGYYQDKRTSSEDSLNVQKKCGTRDVIYITVIVVLTIALVGVVLFFTVLDSSTGNTGTLKGEPNSDSRDPNAALAAKYTTKAPAKTTTTKPNFEDGAQQFHGSDLKRLPGSSTTTTTTTAKPIFKPHEMLRGVVRPTPRQTDRVTTTAQPKQTMRPGPANQVGFQQTRFKLGTESPVTTTTAKRAPNPDQVGFQQTRFQFGKESPVTTTTAKQAPNPDDLKPAPFGLSGRNEPTTTKTTTTKK